MYSVLARKEQAHDDGIWALAWSTCDDGQEYIITGSVDNNVKVWSWLVKTKNI
jgi:WD repeat-containing protein 61